VALGVKIIVNLPREEENQWCKSGRWDSALPLAVIVRVNIATPIVNRAGFVAWHSGHLPIGAPDFESKLAESTSRGVFPAAEFFWRERDCARQESVRDPSYGFTVVFFAVVNKEVAARARESVLGKEKLSSKLITLRDRLKHCRRCQIWGSHTTSPYSGLATGDEANILAQYR
jgi:hypothetical protein